MPGPTSVKYARLWPETVPKRTSKLRLGPRKFSLTGQLSKRRFVGVQSMVLSLGMKRTISSSMSRTSVVVKELVGSLNTAKSESEGPVLSPPHPK